MSNLTEFENFKSKEPEGMMCTTCVYRLKPVVIGDLVQDRSGYGRCEKYYPKPHDVLWEGAKCVFYKERKERN